MTSYGHTYLTSYGWTGTGTGLRKDAIVRPLTIPQKKNLSGLGKDRDEAFPFWDHLFAAASKAITIRVASDDEDVDDDGTEDLSRTVRRTTTGILSNRRPVSVSTTHSHPSLLTTAKREAAKRGLYARFFRGPVLGPDEPCEHAAPSSCTFASTPADEPACEQDEAAKETKKGRKRKPADDAETKEERRERKRLRKEREAARAVERAENKDGRPSDVDEVTRPGDDTSSKRTRKRTRKPPPGEKLEEEFTRDEHQEQGTSCGPPSKDPTDASDIVPSIKKKNGKRKSTPH